MDGKLASEISASHMSHKNAYWGNRKYGARKNNICHTKLPKMQSLFQGFSIEYFSIRFQQKLMESVKEKFLTLV